MWLPLVSRSMPWLKSWSATAGVMPMPPEAFSPLATTRSMKYWSTSRGTSSSTARRPGLPTISPINRMFMPGAASAGVLYRPGLPDDGNLDLAGIAEVLLDLFSHLPAQQCGFLVVDLIRLHDEPDFPARLDGVGFTDAAEGEGHLLQVFQALDISLQHLPAGPGTGPGEGIGGLDQDGHDALRRDVFVVGGDGVYQLGGFAAALGQIGADQGVHPFGFLIHRLADVVQQAGPSGEFAVEAQFRGHDTTQVTDLHGVLEDVLRVAGAVFQPAQQFDEIRMEAMHP